MGNIWSGVATKHFKVQRLNAETIWALAINCSFKEKETVRGKNGSAIALIWIAIYGAFVAIKP